MPHTLSTSYYRMQFDFCPFAHLHKKTIPKGQQPLGMFRFYLILSSDHTYFLHGFTNYYVVHPGLNLCIQSNGLPIGKSACHNLIDFHVFTSFMAYVSRPPSVYSIFTSFTVWVFPSDVV